MKKVRITNYCLGVGTVTSFVLILTLGQIRLDPLRRDPIGSTVLKNQEWPHISKLKSVGFVNVFFSSYFLPKRKQRIPKFLYFNP